MTKTFLIATVAALAITVPAQAERSDKARGQRAEQGQKAQAQGREQRAERPQKAQRQVREQRANRSVERARPEARSFERRERASFNRERASISRARAQERAVERRARASSPRIEARQVEARQQRAERRIRAADNRAPDRAFERRVRSQDRDFERSVRQDRSVERRARSIENRALARQRVENRQRLETRQRVERQARFNEDRAKSRDRAIERRARATEDRGRLASQRALSRERIAAERIERREGRADRFAQVQQPQFERSLDERRFDERRFDERWALDTRRQRNWESFTSRAARYDDDDWDDRRVRLVRVGERWDPDWYDDYVPWGYSNLYYDTPNYYYRYDYDDGYLYRVRRDDNLVLALIPLLGGAYSVGQPLPFYYQSYYNVPLGYSTLYYDTPDYYYRYGGGAIYQVDPTSQLIAGIVALLTGQSFGIGQMLPLGYDVYNVPYAYRGTYFDTDDMWYRYDDGYIYGVDPHTRLIETAYPAYGGYAVGYPVPFGYAGYNYNVPYAYHDLYYDAPGYNYHLASGGIYQIDPATQVVAALVALVTGQNFGVGQRLPLGYDVYNVPLGYRDAYYDSDRYMYRYADGYIYQVDPRTRVIGRVIDVV